LFLIGLLLVHIAYLINIEWTKSYLPLYVFFNIIITLYFLSIKINLFDLSEYINKTIDEIEKAIVFDNVRPISEPKKLQDIKQFVKEINKVILYLNQKNKAAQSFNANIAHELKTPLTELKANLEYFLYYTSLQDDLTNEIQSFIKKIDNLENIISQMLYVSNNNIKKLNNTMQRVLLNDIVYKVVETKEKNILEKNLDLEIVINQAIAIHGHEELLKHAVGNIIDNAIKYSYKQSKIKIILSIKNGFIYFVVKDEGIGIHKKDLKLVFHPYYRGENALSNNDGYGLGLSLATWIFELHSATIKIRSTKGKGTLILVKFFTS